MGTLRKITESKNEKKISSYKFWKENQNSDDFLWKVKCFSILFSNLWLAKTSSSNWKTICPFAELYTVLINTSTSNWRTLALRIRTNTLICPQWSQVSSEDQWFDTCNYPLTRSIPNFYKTPPAKNLYKTNKFISAKKDTQILNQDVVYVSPFR